MDPRIRIRIRIHTKMSRIRNTVKNHVFPADAPDNCQRLKRRTYGIVLGLDSTSALQRNPGNFWQSGVWESAFVKKVLLYAFMPYPSSNRIKIYKELDKEER